MNKNWPFQSPEAFRSSSQDVKFVVWQSYFVVVGFGHVQKAWRRLTSPPRPPSPTQPESTRRRSDDNTCSTRELRRSLEVSWLYEESLWSWEFFLFFMCEILPLLGAYKGDGIRRGGGEGGGGGEGRIGYALRVVRIAATLEPLYAVHTHMFPTCELSRTTRMLPAAMRKECVDCSRWRFAVCFA